MADFLNAPRCARGLFFAAILGVLFLTTVRGQQPEIPPAAGVPVTTPAAASQPPSSAPAPNVSAAEAVPVQQMPSPAAPNNAPDQVLWALIVSYAIEYLKKSSWFPWITETSPDRLKAQFGFLTAFLTAAGIKFAVSGSVWEGEGASVTIAGLSVEAVKTVVFQWASQQAWFDLLTHRRSGEAPLLARR